MNIKSCNANRNSLRKNDYKKDFIDLYIFLIV